MTTQKPKLPINKVKIAFAMFLSNYERKWEQTSPQNVLDDVVFWLENDNDK